MTTFGVEMEIKGHLNTVRAAMRDTGLPFESESYNHSTRPHWKIVSDASVRGGWEIVSPILEGPDGLAQVTKVCRALTARGIKVDRECGLHVHVGVGQISKVAFGRIAKNFVFFEPFFDSVVSASRRMNQYAKSNWKSYDRGDTTADHQAAYNDIWDRVEAAHDHRSIAQAISGGTNDRFRKLNLTAFWRHQTVEFRQHQGTTDAVKVCEWVKLCVAFVERSIAGNPRKITKPYTVAALTAQVFRMTKSAPEAVAFFKGRADHFRASIAAV